MRFSGLLTPLAFSGGSPTCEGKGLTFGTSRERLANLPLMMNAGKLEEEPGDSRQQGTRAPTRLSFIAISSAEKPVPWDCMFKVI